MVGDEDAALIERGEDLVGDRGLAAKRVADRLAGRVDGEAARLAGRHFEGFFGVLQQAAGAASVARRQGRADAHENAQRSGRCGDRLRRNALREARGGDRQLLFCGRRQQRGELAAGEMGDDVGRANGAGEAASDRRDRLVGRFVAITAVEVAEILEPTIATEKPASPGRASPRRASSARANARRSGRPAASPTLGVSSSAISRIRPWARAGRPLASALQRPKSSTAQAPPPGVARR